VPDVFFCFLKKAEFPVLSEKQVHDSSSTGHGFRSGAAEPDLSGEFDPGSE
jgi:hypothetical protein